MDFYFSNIFGILTTFNIIWSIVLVSFMIWAYRAIKNLRIKEERLNIKVKQIEKDYVKSDVMYYGDYDIYNGDDV